MPVSGSVVPSLILKLGRGWPAEMAVTFTGAVVCVLGFSAPVVPLFMVRMTRLALAVKWAGVRGTDARAV